MAKGRPSTPAPTMAVVLWNALRRQQHAKIHTSEARARAAANCKFSLSSSCTSCIAITSGRPLLQEGRRAGCPPHDCEDGPACRQIARRNMAHAQKHCTAHLYHHSARQGNTRDISKPKGCLRKCLTPIVRGTSRCAGVNWCLLIHAVQNGNQNAFLTALARGNWLPGRSTKGLTRIRGQVLLRNPL